MDERDHQAINEEMNRQSCLCTVIFSLVELAKIEYGEFEQEFIGYQIGMNCAEEEWEGEIITELKEVKDVITNNDILGAKIQDKDYFICEDNWTVIKKKYRLINTGWKRKLIHLINAL